MRALSTCVIPILSDLLSRGTSVALRQMSRALLASPETAATFRDTNSIASESNAGISLSLACTIVCSCLKEYGWNMVRVRPIRLATRPANALSGRSMVLAIASTVSRVPGRAVQSNRLYRSVCFRVQSRSTSSSRTTTYRVSSEQLI